MSYKRILFFSFVGLLSVVVVFLFVGMQIIQNHPEPFEAPVAETSDETMERYEGVVVEVSVDADLLHILDNERGLTALQVPLESRLEVAEMEDGDRVIVSGEMDTEQEPNVLWLYRVISVEEGDELTPEENVRLNSEFRGLRQ